MADRLSTDKAYKNYLKKKKESGTDTSLSDDRYQNYLSRKNSMTSNISTSTGDAAYRYASDVKEAAINLSRKANASKDIAGTDATTEPSKFSKTIDNIVGKGIELSNNSYLKRAKQVLDDVTTTENSSLTAGIAPVKATAQSAYDAFNFITGRERKTIGDAITEKIGKAVTTKDGITNEEYTENLKGTVDKYDDKTKELATTIHDARAKQNAIRNRAVDKRATYNNREAYDIEQNALKEMQDMGYSEDEINDIVNNVSWVQDQEDVANDSDALTNKIQNGKAGTQVKYNLYDVAASQVSGFPATINTITSLIKGERVNTASSDWSQVNRINTIENTQDQMIVDAVDKKVGYEGSNLSKLASFGYQTGISTEKSMASMAAGAATAETLGVTGEAASKVANLVTLPQFGASSFAASYKEGQERGLNDTQNILTATAAGSLEMFTEMYSLDSLMEMFESGGEKKLAERVFAGLKQAGIEGSEEAVNDIGNEIVDRVINQDKSSYEQTIAYLMSADGGSLTREEAEVKATEAFFLDTAKDFAAGALSGAFSGVVTSSAANTHQMVQDLRLGESAINNPTSAAKLVSDDRANYSSDATYDNSKTALENLNSYAKQSENGAKVSLKDKRNLGKALRSSAVDINNVNESTTTPAEFRTTKLTEKETLAAINNAASPYQLKKALESASEETLAIRNASRLKENQLKAHNFTDSDIKNALTVEQVYAKSYSGATISDEDINTLPEEDRAKATIARQVGHNRNVIENNENTFIDKSDNNAYSLDADVETKVEDGNLYVKDTEGNFHSVSDIETVGATKSAIDFAVFAANQSNSSKIAEAAIKFSNENQSVSKVKLNATLSDMVQASRLGIELKQFEEKHKDVKSFNGYKDFYNTVYENTDHKDTGKQTTKAKKNTGAIRFAESDNTHAAEEAYKSLNRTQKKFLELFGKRIGVDFEIYVDTESKTRGQYVPEEGKIRLNLNYSDKILTVALHEGIGEFLQAHAGDEYYKVAQKVIEYFYNNAEFGFTEVASMYLNVYQHSGELNKNERDSANEFVNDQLGKIFSTDSNLKKFIKWLKSNDKSYNETANVFVKFFNDMKKWMQEAFKDAPHFLDVREDVAFCDQVASDFLEAMDVAIDKRNEDAKKFEDAGISVDTNTSTVTRNSIEVNIAENWQKMGYGSYESAIDDIAKSIAKNVDDTTVDQAKEWLKSEESLAALILSDPELNAMYNYKSDDRYQAIKKNSDYPQGTADFSNLCRKREIFTMLFDNLQSKYKDTLFNADDIAKIRQIMTESDLEVACALCYVEDRRQKMGEIANLFIDTYKEALTTDSKRIYKRNAQGDLKPLNASKPTLKRYKMYGITRELYASDDYVPNQYDLTTYQGFLDLTKNHPAVAAAFDQYNNARGMQSARLVEGHAEYKREILKYTPKQIQKINNNGGLRIFSFSDFEAVHMIDLIQIISDCSAMGIKVQAYTKVPAFANFVRNTNVKLNRSLIPATSKSKETYIRENGKFVKAASDDRGIADIKGKEYLAFDTVEGINVNDEYFVDESNSSSIGNVLIGINDRQIRLAMADEFVDYIIPFHSGQSLNVLHTKGIGTWKNYKDFQEDKALPTHKKGQKARINIYTEVLNKYNITNKREFVEKFLEECEKNDLEPRFSDFLDKENGKYVYTEGYHKFLIDYKLFDKDGNILPQKVVKPDFENDTIKDILLKDADRAKKMSFSKEIMDRIENEVVNAKRQSIDVDSEGNALTKDQSEFFKDSKAVDENGNLLALYHGTYNAGFTVFKGRIWLTTSRKDAASYAGSDIAFDPNEKRKDVAQTGGTYKVNGLRFESKEDLDLFLKENNISDSDFNKYKSPREIYNAREEAESEDDEDALDEIDELEKISNKINKAYVTYERQHSELVLWKDMIDNKEQYSVNDLKRALYENNNGNVFFDDEFENYDTDEEYRDALAESMQFSYDEDPEAYDDYYVFGRIPEGKTSVAENLNKVYNRVYESYANIKNPYIIDGKGKHSEFYSGDIYSDIDKALKSGKYDGVIVKNWRVGRYQELGTVVVTENPNAIKLKTNEHPTENEDIRKSLSIKDMNNLSEEDRKNYLSFTEQLINYEASGRKTHKPFVVLEKTPELYSKLGLEDKPIMMTHKHYHDSLKPKNPNNIHEHGLLMEEVAEAPIIINHPAMIFDSLSTEDGIVVVANSLDSDHFPIIIAIKTVDGENLAYSFKDSNMLASMYGHNDFDNLVQNSIALGKVLYINQKNSQSLYSKRGLPLPLQLKKIGFDKIIHPSENVVKNGDIKKKQLEIILKANPMQDDYHTGIRTIDDIKSFKELLDDPEYADYDEYTPDYTKRDAKKAYKDGEITVYSSYPIKNGVFVSTSRMEAESYSGDGKVYSETVDLNDVAWIDPLQGEYAKTSTLVKETKRSSIDVDTARFSLNVPDETSLYKDAFDQIDTITQIMVTSAQDFHTFEGRKLKKEYMSHVKNELLGKYNLSFGADFLHELDEDLAQFDKYMRSKDMSANTAIDYAMQIADKVRERSHYFAGGNNFENDLVIATDLVEKYLEQIGKSDSDATESKNITKAAKDINKSNEKYKKQLDNNFKDQVEEIKQTFTEREKRSTGVDTLSVAAQREIEKRATHEAKKKLQNLKENEEKAKQRDSIIRTCERLINWMDNPTNERHVPQFMQKPLKEAIRAIDFMPNALMKDPNATTQSAVKWQVSMQKLANLIEDISKVGNSTLEDNDTEAIQKYQLSLVMEAENLFNEMDHFLQINGGVVSVNNLDADNMKQLHKFMSAISSAITHMNTLYKNRKFETTKDLATKSMSEMEDLKPVFNTSKNPMKSVMHNFLNVSMLEPITFFEEFGDAASTVMDEFFDGEKTGINIVHEAEDFFTDLHKKMGLTVKDTNKWAKEVHKIGDSDMYLTTADIMALYASDKRETLDQKNRPDEATHHISAGGYKARTFKIGAKTYNNNPRVYHGGWDSIISMLTQEQKDYVDAVVQYMSTTLSDHGNKTSQELYGYDKFNGMYYFPLKTDSLSRETKESNAATGQATMRNIINSSFTKTQLDRADSPLVINDFFDVVTEHIMGMANYCAYAMPVSDALRWYNYSEITRTPVEGMEHAWTRSDRSVKMYMVRAKGTKARNYFETLLRDINLDNKSQGSEMLTKLIGLYKAQAVAGNLRVVIQQPAAIARALDEIENKYLLKGIAYVVAHPKKAVEEAQKNSYLCYWKSKGFSDTRISQGMKEVITGNATKVQDIVEKTGILAGLADDVSWAAMYKAAELKAQDQSKGKKLTDEELRAKTDDIFSEVINHTQVIDSTLRKTEQNRNKDLLQRIANAFKNEPQKTYNMLHRKLNAYNQARNKDDKKAATKALRKTLVIYAYAAVVTGIAQSIADAFRDDDDDTWFNKFLAALLPEESFEAVKTAFENGSFGYEDFKAVYAGAGNILDNMNPLTLVPYISEIDSILKGFDSTRMDTEVFTTIDDMLTKVEGTSATTYGKLYSISKAVSMATGIPVSNIMREFKVINNNFLTNIAPWGKLYTSNSVQKQAEKEAKDNATAEVYDSGNLNSIKEHMTSTYNSKFEDAKASEAENPESEAWSAVRDELKDQFKRQYAATPEDKLKLKNQYVMLLKKTKSKDSGKSSYSYLSDKEASAKVESWIEAVDKENSN